MATRPHRATTSRATIAGRAGGEQIYRSQAPPYLAGGIPNPDKHTRDERRLLLLNTPSRRPLHKCCDTLETPKDGSPAFRRIGFRLNEAVYLTSASENLPELFLGECPFPQTTAAKHVENGKVVVNPSICGSRPRRTRIYRLKRSSRGIATITRPDGNFARHGKIISRDRSSV